MFSAGSGSSSASDPPRRPLGDWTSPAISILWLGRHINPDAYDLVEWAWQELFKEPAWAEWIAAHRDELTADPIMYLLIEERSDTRSLKRKDGIHLYVPESVFDETADIRDAARGILRRLYQLRAEKTGMAEPPGLSRPQPGSRDGRLASRK